MGGVSDNSSYLILMRKPPNDGGFVCVVSLLVTNYQLRYNTPMPVTARTIASNTILYTGALTMQKVLSFIYFSYLARSLGAELTGKYFFALSLAAIVMISSLSVSAISPKAKR